MNIEIESLLVKILKHELNLQQNQIFIYNQDFTLEKAFSPEVLVNMPNLFCCVEFSMQDIISNNVNYYWDSSGNMIQSNNTNTKETIILHFASRTKEARIRKVEVYQAIQSLYSEQMQELYQCRIFQIPDTLFSGKAAKTREYSYVQGLEGGVLIYYFNIILYANVWYKKEKIVDSYYDAFNTEVFTNEHALETDTPTFSFDIPSS